MSVRLGGFVIHGNNKSTLKACVESLRSVCDEVVAVDSCSTDGSAELVRSLGARSETLPWQGFGAARAKAMSLLAPADYVFFLDSDEDPSRIREAYGDRIHRRLAEVKARYDPDNVFHHNNNIRPARAVRGG